MLLVKSSILQCQRKRLPRSLSKCHCTLVTAYPRVSYLSSITLKTTFLLHYVHPTVRDYSQISAIRTSLFLVRCSLSKLSSTSSLSLSRLPVDLERPIDGVSRLPCLDTTPSIYRNASWRWSNVEQIPKCRCDCIFVRCFSTGDAKKRDITASMGRSSRTTTFVSLPRMNTPPWSTVACSPLLPDTCRCFRVWSASSKREINGWLMFVNVKERILKYSKIY